MSDDWTTPSFSDSAWENHGLSRWWIAVGGIGGWLVECAQSWVDDDWRMLSGVVWRLYIGYRVKCILPPLEKLPTLRWLGAAQPYMPEEPALLPPHTPTATAALCCALAACGPTGVPHIARGLRLPQHAPFHPHPLVVFAQPVLRRSSARPEMHPAWNASEKLRPALSHPVPHHKLAAWTMWGGSVPLPSDFFSGSLAPTADMEPCISSPICGRPAEFRLA